MAISFVIILALICLMFSSPSFAGSRALNNIDACTLRDDWEDDRMRLAECAVGFGAGTDGGRDGKYYLVNTTDDDPANPQPGMLRWGVTRNEPLWIVFIEGDMVFRLQEELIINSYKTIDGRGSNVSFVGPACLVVQQVRHVILHNFHVYDCTATKGGHNVMSTEEHVGLRGPTEGDAVSIWAASNVWVDHLYLSHSADGLIDAVEGSTNITVSNCRLANHNEAMLFGHDDNYGGDKNLRATFIYNLFTNLTQRCPRCREGHCEVVNNVYENWGMYAIGGSAGVTFRSQANSYFAPFNETKEVTKRIIANDDWRNWNWISEDDLFWNGAYFTPSGSTNRLNSDYVKATSVVAMDTKYVFDINSLAGPLQCPKKNRCHKYS